MSFSIIKGARACLANIANDIGLREILNLCKHTRIKFTSYIVGLLGCALMEVSIYVLVPFVLKYMIDGVVNRDMLLLKKSIIMVIVQLVFFCVFFALFTYIFHSSVEKIVKSIKIELFSHISKLPLLFMENNHSGNIISVFTNDLKEIDRLYREIIREMIFAIGTGLSCFVGMLILNWKAAIILVIICFISAIINGKFIRVTRILSQDMQQEKGRMSEAISDILSGYSVIKIYSNNNNIFKNFNISNDKIKRLRFMHIKKSGIIELINFFIGWINFGGIIAVGAVLVAKKMIQFGTVVALLNLLTGVNVMIRRIGGILVKFQPSIAAAKRVINLLNQPIEKETTANSFINDTDATIELKDICFSYDGENFILNGLNISVKKGQVAALVGPSGGGKSSIVKLLLGFYVPNKGIISICGKNIDSYRLNQLRDLIAYVPQDAYIINGTIEENIRIGKPNATDEEIISAAKEANAHEFIINLPNQYKTYIGEQGDKLSGGQCQRIAIARAILKDAPIILLDEVTSSLDLKNESAIQETLLMNGRTTFVIAHRLSTIKHADIIYVINNGKVEEAGNHESLLSNGGLYEKLIKLQFSES